MVRNIPLAYTQEMLLLEWPVDGQYDFLYVPRSHRGPSHLGYAFINFVSEELALEFRRRWHGKSLAHAEPNARHLSILAADVQGFDANLRQLKKKRVCRITQPEWRPILVRDGCRIELSSV